MTIRATWLLALLGLGLPLLVGVTSATAVPRDQYSATRKLKNLEGVTVTEKLGAKLPLDATFRDEHGHPTTLRKLLIGEKPVILTFNYSDCPMLCSVQLGGLVDAMTEMPGKLGDAFDVVTIGLDASETPARASETKARYLKRMDAANKDRGWRFVTGDAAVIRQVADAVGFGYRFLPDKKQYAHPAVLILLTPNGTVSQYVYGVTYPPEKLTAALAVAAAGDSKASLNRFILACYHYVALTGNAKSAASLMRYAGAGFLLLMAAVAGAYVWRRRRVRGGEVP